MHANSAPYDDCASLIQQKALSAVRRPSQSSPPSVHFENFDLEELSRHTAPGYALLKSSQSTANLHNIQSNTWDTKLMGTVYPHIIISYHMYSYVSGLLTIIIFTFICMIFFLFSEKPPDTSWDVAAFKILCKIKPTDGKKIMRVINESVEGHGKLGVDMMSNADSVLSGGSNGVLSGSSPAVTPGLCPMFGATTLPEVEQTLRLISYQGEHCAMSAEQLSALDNHIPTMHVNPFSMLSVTTSDGPQSHRKCEHLLGPR